MSDIKVDSITNAAGTGAPDFPNGFTNSETVSEVRVYTGNNYGSTNTVIRRFSDTDINTGTGITYADSATLGATFTVNDDGIYAVTYVDAFSAGEKNFGISINSNQLTTNIANISDVDRYAMETTPNTSGSISHCGWVGCLASGDVVRAHTDGSTQTAGGTGRILFHIIQLLKT